MNNYEAVDKLGGMIKWSRLLNLDQYGEELAIKEIYIKKSKGLDIPVLYVEGVCESPVTGPEFEFLFEGFPVASVRLGRLRPKDTFKVWFVPMKAYKAVKRYCVSIGQEPPVLETNIDDTEYRHDIL